MSEGINWGQLMKDSADAFQPLPKGLYDFVVDKCDPKTSSTNKAMWSMVLKVESGPHAGRTVYNNITLTTDNPMALRMFFVNMQAFGLDQAFFATNPSPAAIAAALIGKRVRAEIDHRPYQGQTRENIKKLMPAGGVFSGGPGIPVPGGPGIPGASPIPTPTVAPPTVPTPPQTSPVPSAPAPQPVPTAPQPAGPSTESTIPIPQPTAPAPPAEAEAEVPHAAAQEETLDMRSPEAKAADETPQLPPGFDSQEQYDAFLAWQAQNAAPAQPQPQPTSTGAVPPPLPF